MNEMLKDFCGLYNAGLQQRIEAWQRKKVSLTYGMQCIEIKECRLSNVGLERWSFTAEQQVLRRLDKTYKAFFGRVKRGDTAGFPRFKASARYNTAEFRVSDGLTVNKDRIGVVGVPGAMKVKLHRELPSKPKSALINRRNGKWYVIFHVEVVAAGARSSGDSVGIDLGLTNLAALSNGELIARPNWTKKAAKGLRKRQRAVARCKRGSKRRKKAVARLAHYHEGIRNRRADHLHKLSSDLTRRFSHIAIENLNIKGLARGILSKHVNDAAWSQLVSYLHYKAEKAGGVVIEVDPRGTSQTCPECGTIKRKELSERMHRCECGCVMDRDVAAAQVVHFRAFNTWPGTGLQLLSRAVA